ncbi:MAG: element excision factor XisH family protein [Cyanobacteria bacterium P01_D01_bin.115]
MSTRDAFHPIVKTALQKDGWTITDDSYHLGLGFTIVDQRCETNW